MSRKGRDRWKKKRTEARKGEKRRRRRRKWIGHGVQVEGGCWRRNVEEGMWRGGKGGKV